MIISLYSDSYGQNDYFICPRASLSIAELRARMLDRAKVNSGSYASGLIDCLYADIFIHSLDLKKDYTDFFEKEYEKFGEYLRKRMRFPREVVQELQVAFDISSAIYRFRPRFSFLNDEYGLEFLTTLIEDEPQERE